MGAAKGFSHMVWKALVLITAFLLLSQCGGAPPEVTEKKDTVHFTLPQRVMEQAPDMQTHLYRMLHFNSMRFKIKPAFVFLDDNEFTMGRLDPSTFRLNLLHVALWEGDKHLWSGSLMHGVGKGVHVFSKRGYELALRSREGHLNLIFRDGDRVGFEQNLPVDQDEELTLKNGPFRLYINAYVFPEEVVNAPEGPLRFGSRAPRSQKPKDTAPPQADPQPSEGEPAQN